MLIPFTVAADTTGQARQLYQQGETALYAGQYQQAIDAFDQCLAILPSATTLAPNKDFTEADIWTNKGDAYMGLKQYDKAVAALDKATLLDPSYAEAFQFKAQALRELNRTVEADAAETGMEQAAQKRLDELDRAAFAQPTTKADLTLLVPALGIFGAALLSRNCRKTR